MKHFKRNENGRLQLVSVSNEIMFSYQAYNTLFLDNLKVTQVNSIY